VVPLPHGVFANELHVSATVLEQSPLALTHNRCSYGMKHTAVIGPLQHALRKELYPPDAPYHSVNWESVRNQCASIDLYAPHTV
jgi:hypothetical protein